MKNKYGKINNINKKILSSMMAAILITVPLTGCDNTKLKYKTNEQGQLVCVNEIDHSYISNYKVVVFELNGKQNISIAEVIEYSTFGRSPRHEKYFNIFGNQLIYDTSKKDTDLVIVEEEYLTSYLILYNKVKNKYQENDLKEILELIKSDYKKENNKVLVKGK